MSLFGKFFDNKKTQSVAFSSSAEQSGDHLPLPAIVRRRSIPAGKHTLERHFGDIHQARPPKKAQLWQACDEQDVSCSLALMVPGDENREWLAARLGKVNIRKWRKINTKGPLQKFGSQLILCIFETVIAGRYIIKKYLSGDPLQETYQAWDSEKKRPVYCTIYLPQKAVPLPKNFVAREKKDPGIHPRFLEVLDEGLCKPHGQFAIYRYKFPALYYVITSYVPATSFAAFVDQQKRRVQPEHVYLIIKQIGDILAALQQEHMIHGNVRPQTLWIGTEGKDLGQLYLNGFSAVHSQSARKTTATYMLRHCCKHVYPLYMAPEQISDGDSDSRADYFSLGIIIYQLVIGKNPFYNKDYREVLGKIARWQIGTKLPLPKGYRWLQTPLQKLLQPDRQQRVEDWKAFLALLQDSYLKSGTEEEESEKIVVADPVKLKVKEVPIKKEREPRPSVGRATFDADMGFEDMLDTGKDFEEDQGPKFEDFIDTRSAGQADTLALDQKPAAKEKKTRQVDSAAVAHASLEKARSPRQFALTKPQVDTDEEKSSRIQNKHEQIVQPAPVSEESSIDDRAEEQKYGKPIPDKALPKSKSKFGQAFSIFRKMMTPIKKVEMATPQPLNANDDNVWEKAPSQKTPEPVAEETAEEKVTPTENGEAPVAPEHVTVSSEPVLPTEEEIEDLSNEELANLAIDERQVSNNIIVTPPPNKETKRQAALPPVDSGKEAAVIKKQAALPPVDSGKEAAVIKRQAALPPVDSGKEAAVASPPVDSGKKVAVVTRKKQPKKPAKDVHSAIERHEKEELWEEISPQTDTSTERLEQFLVDSFEEDSEAFVIDDEVTGLSRPKVMPVAVPPVAETLSPELQAQLDAMDDDEELDYLDSQEIFLKQMQQKKSETQKPQDKPQVDKFVISSQPAKIVKKSKNSKIASGKKKKSGKIAPDRIARPKVSEEEEDFEWEKEFEVVSNSLSQWEDTDEDDIIGIDGANIKEEED